MKTSVLRLLCYIFIPNASLVCAQEDQLLREILLDSAAFTTYEQQIWDSIAQESTTLSMRLVEVKGVPEVLSEDILAFVIPGENDTIHARGMYLQKSTDTVYTWWGESSNYSDPAYIGIASNTGGRLAYISYNEKIFIYHPLSYRYNAQVEINPDTVIGAEPEIEMPADITPDPSCEVDTCKSIATVLVLVTPEATNEILGRFKFLPSSYQPLYALLYLYLGELMLNYALVNSGLVGKSARFVTEEFDDFEYQISGLIGDDLYALIQNFSAANRFHTNRADMLVLLTDTRYGSYVGAASSLSPAAIVTASNLLGPRFTFAHEIGHLLGARHNRVSNNGDEPDESGACNYGYRFTAVGDVVRYTIMAKTLEADAVRIPYFSNPDIEWAGTPIGTGFSNNSGYISETFCEVATNLYADDELEINIDGPLSITCDQTATYTIDIDPPGAGIPGNAPYSYAWYMGESPYINPFSGGAVYLGNSSDMTIEAGDINYDKFWLWASIYSSDLVFASDLIEVEKDPCFGFGAASFKNTDFELQSAVFTVWPNPADDFLIINCAQPEKHNRAKYLIANAPGQIFSIGNLSWENDFEAEIHLNLDPGLYILHLETESVASSHKFIVHR